MNKPAQQVNWEVHKEEGLGRDSVSPARIAELLSEGWEFLFHVITPGNEEEIYFKRPAKNAGK